MRIVAGAAVLAALASLLPRANALDVPLCCACIPVVERAQTSGTNRTANEALFCAASAEGEQEPLAERCQNAAESANLICYATLDNSTCRANLAEQGIVCPGAGVPAAGPLNLATLAVSLAAAGGLLLRYRRRA